MKILNLNNTIRYSMFFNTIVFPIQYQYLVLYRVPGVPIPKYSGGIVAI